MIPILMLAVRLMLAQPMRESEACRPCHTAIFESYSRTGMGRSFTPVEFASLDEFRAGARFYHAPSARHYQMKLAGGKPVQRRWQLDGAGREVNVIEMEIHFIIGSGNHSRTYAHRKPSGKLVQLPVSWYSEDGGHCAMSPGYDRPRHSDFQREIPDSCLFCHNGYPRADGLAHGIDCTRCHAAAADHFRNPAKMTAERQLEVCLQCHLESASRSLPDSIRRFDRPPFSYRAGEPLGDFQIYFDRDAGRDDSFTVNHSAYGMFQSRCFLESKDRLTCVTCHDPHRDPRAADYAKACRGCHSAAHADRASGCTGCHMPKRRTEDAVHVVMTDHRIQRLPPAKGLLDSRVERHGRYEGPVRLLYPRSLSDTMENRLYQAVAALGDAGRLKENAAELERLLALAEPRLGGFDLALADAFRRLRQPAKAERHYRRGVELDPVNVTARIGLAEILILRGANSEAAKLLEATPPDTAVLNTLAVARTGQGDYSGALAVLEKAALLDPGLAMTWFNQSIALRALGRAGQAAEAMRRAVQLDPDLAGRNSKTF